MQSLQGFSHILVESLKLRQKYMSMSHQHFPRTVKNYLQKAILDENSNEISNSTPQTENITIEEQGIILFI